MDILCFGEPMLEFNEQSDGRFLAGHGGDTSNCAVAASRSGARVGVLTHLGADAAGDSFMQLWKNEGIDTEAVARNAHAHTGIYFITHGPDGHSFSYLRKGSAASLIRPSDIDPEVIGRAGILHVSGITQAISDTSCDAAFAAIDAARSAGVKVSYDTNLRQKLWPLPRARAVIHAAMEMADIALPGLEDAEALTGLSDPDAIADFYLGLGAETVALTLGSDGTLVAAGDRRERVAAFPVEAVDATAAGDTFDGAFLAELRAGSDPFVAARYANAAAALSTQGYGAVAPMPTRNAVEAFLRERGDG
ncbi:2-dehydro-3-deoxygluconokinase [Roseivivax jejudonensis]|uniref:2-dehydro-3-deoxygluconokinase n=2 Tax=Roseivivax jejudonensis TaxID=1529041 RepID=A0A1X6Y413_9RHOB|nr:2-dehydro-3-deoxygluconokinase [Roseivivax jejudonensis]